jgi:hypothetical protein
MREMESIGETRHRSQLTWHRYLDRLFIAFGVGCLIGAGLVLLSSR